MRYTVTKGVGVQFYLIYCLKLIFLSNFHRLNVLNNNGASILGGYEYI